MNDIHANNFKDITGQTFGNVKVLEYAGRSFDRKALWKCKCLLCGKTFVCTGKNLRNGNTKSCGCLQRASVVKRNTTHGITKRKHGHHIYRIYYDIVRRCYNKNRPGYQNYGGRGIYIVPEWYTPGVIGNPGFVNFYNWAIANGWHNGVEIDRINNDGPYAPWNCRFVDKYGNTNNRRNNRYISDGEELLTFGQFEHKYNLIHGYVRGRVERGWLLDAVVHSVKCPDLHITLNKNNQFSEYVDQEGFVILIPKYSSDVEKGAVIYHG